MKNRLTFSTLGTTTLTFDQIISKAKHFGMNTIELRGVLDNIAISDIPFLKPENRKNTKAKLEEEGIGICVFGSSAVFHSDLNFAISECEYAVEAARELSVPYIRVFADKYENEDMLSQVICGLREATRIAKGSGVKILLETHGDFVTKSRLMKLVDEVDSGDLGLIWDIQHTFLAGEDFEKFALDMLPLIHHVHIKDVKADGTLCLPGEGTLDFYNAANHLNSLGYKGLFSLEWEKRWHPELPDIDEALNRYVNIMTK